MTLAPPKPPYEWFITGGSGGKESSHNAGELGLIPGLRRFLGEGNATHFSILAWRIPSTEEPGGLQSTGSQRVRHNWSNYACVRAHSWPFSCQQASTEHGVFARRCALGDVLVINDHINPQLSNAQAISPSWWTMDLQYQEATLHTLTYVRPRPRSLPLWASVSSSVKWDSHYCFTVHLGGLKEMKTKLWVQYLAHSGPLPTPPQMLIVSASGLGAWCPCHLLTEPCLSEPPDCP